MDGGSTAARARPADRAPDASTTRAAPLEPASWDEALDRIARQVRAIQEEHGRDAIGVFGGGGLSNETAYMLGKFARVALRSRHIDYNGRFCMASAAAAGNKALGIDRGLPFPLEDLPQAEVILLVGGNPAEALPVMMQYFEAQKANGGQLIVADPAPDADRARGDPAPSDRSGHRCGVGQRPASRRRSRAADRLRLHRDRGTTGFEAVRHAVAPFWPDRVERITGVPAAKIERAARLLRRRPDGDRPDRAGAGAAEQRRQQRPGLHQPGAGAGQGRPPHSAAGAR